LKTKSKTKRGATMDKMTGLTSEEMDICRKMGIDPHAFIETSGKIDEERRKRDAPIPREDEARISAMFGNPAIATNAIESSDSGTRRLMDEAEQAVMKAMKITPERYRKLQEQNEAAKLSCEETEICRKMGILPIDYLAQKMKSAGLTESPFGHMTVK
jgi:hypothetical protein